MHTALNVARNAALGSVICTRRTLLVASGASVLVSLWPSTTIAKARGRDSGLPLMLASEAPSDINPQGFLVSEKYDGVRAYWDGERLRFRSGLHLAAPSGFMAHLPPNVALDGELWLGRGRFDEVSGTVRRAQPQPEDWRHVRYMVFDLPQAGGVFEQRCRAIRTLAEGWRDGPLRPVPQAMVPSVEALAAQLSVMTNAGGEGLMLHRADALHRPGRSTALLKLKPLHDAEALVLAHEGGRGRHAGRLGALRVRSDSGAVFDLGTGFSDTQRDNPPPVGSRVTYSHRGFTPGGTPRFASFLRVRD